MDLKNNCQRLISAEFPEIPTSPAFEDISDLSQSRCSSSFGPDTTMASSQISPSYPSSIASPSPAPPESHLTASTVPICDQFGDAEVPTENDDDDKGNHKRRKTDEDGHSVTNKSATTTDAIDDDVARRRRTVPNATTTNRYDIFHPEVQKMWRQLVRQAHNQYRDDADPQLLELLSEFAEYPGDLPVFPDQIATFLRSDLGLDEKGDGLLFSAMVIGLGELKRKLDVDLSTLHLWNASEPVPFSAMAEKKAKTGVNSAPGNRFASKDVRCSTPENRFASKDVRCSTPSFDSHRRQRKWRDAIVKSLKDGKLKLEPAAVKLVRLFICGSYTTLPLKSDKIANFLRHCLSPFKNMDAETKYSVVPKAVAFLEMVRDETFSAEELAERDSCMVEVVRLKEFVNEDSSPQLCGIDKTGSPKECVNDSTSSQAREMNEKAVCRKEGFTADVLPELRGLDEKAVGYEENVNADALPKPYGMEEKIICCEEGVNAAASPEPCERNEKAVLELYQDILKKNKGKSYEGAYFGFFA